MNFRFAILFTFFLPHFFYTMVNDQVRKGGMKDPDPIHGFEMTNLRIPYAEIKRGGPPKDGIPAIDQPKFINAKQAKDFLSKKDYILGLEINGIVKAYPIRILNYHEIVNDWFDDAPVAITYCPLCASGAAFSARINGQVRTFGVSGLLYNSDVLIYDRQTQSLWSQILGEAISGASSSTPLNLIPTTYTTFENWTSKHPNTLVLSTETGAQRDYSITPYQSYNPSHKLLFPVSNESKIMRKNAKVIGIEIDGQFKAYSFKKLKKAKGPIMESFNGTELIIEYDKAAKSAKIKNNLGQELPTITLYWFAWYAFHPETEVY